jgi:hypothetical protein
MKKLSLVGMQLYLKIYKEKLSLYNSTYIFSGSCIPIPYHVNR